MKKAPRSLVPHCFLCMNRENIIPHDEERDDLLVRKLV